MWGEQSITIMIDYQKDQNIKKDLNVYIDCGSNKLMKLNEFKNKILNNITCGEIILNCMDNDGNGAGLDLNISKRFNNDFKSPLLLMGGAGKPEHIAEGLKLKNISGVVTANLFNFLGSGLEKSRETSFNNGLILQNLRKNSIIIYISYLIYLIFLYFLYLPNFHILEKHLFFYLYQQTCN